MRHKRLCWARREEAAAECGKKKKGGKGDKERSEQRREEGDYLQKKKIPLWNFAESLEE